MRQRNIAFIVTSYWAYGELLIALHFAKAIAHFEYCPYFFIPPSHEKILKAEGFPYTVFIPKLGRINRVLLEDYENRYRPQCVILSDFLNYHFCETHYGLTPEDLKIFRGRIGTFDNFDWSDKKREMDTYGFRASTASKINMDDYGFKLVPCPIANPDPYHQKERYYYPLMDQYLEYQDEKKKAYRERLNLPKNKSIVMVTAAAWQETHKAYPKVNEFVRFANEIYLYLLKQIGKEALILYIGEGSSELSCYQIENMVFLNHITPGMMDQYILASDLFISRNVTSTTLAKVAVSGMPALVIMNSFRKSKNNELTVDFALDKFVSERLLRLEELYEYWMFPVGWYHFLQPVLQGGSYLKLVAQQELINIKATLEAVYLMLHNQDSRERCQERARAYRSSLNALDSPEKILNQIL